MAVAIAIACYLAIKNPLSWFHLILRFHKYRFNFKTSTSFEFGGNEIIPKQ